MSKRSLSKFAARTKKNDDAALKEAARLVGSGLAAYTGTKVIGRLAYAIGKRRSQKVAHHIAPWTTVATALAAMVVAGKWEKLSKYETGILIGSSIAAIQCLLSAYLPQLGWIAGDYELHDQMLMAATQGNKQQQVQARVVEMLPGQSLGPGNGAAETFTNTSSAPQDVDVDLDDFGDIPGMNGSLKTGIFA